MPTKTVYYDTSSLTPSRGDEIELLIQRINQDSPEILNAIYMGIVQIASYTTPFIRLMIGNDVRLVNANDVREIRFTIVGPQAPRLVDSAVEYRTDED